MRSLYRIVGGLKTTLWSDIPQFDGFVITQINRYVTQKTPHHRTNGHATLAKGRANGRPYVTLRALHKYDLMC